MDRQVFKGIRLPAPLVRKIERTARKEGSTFSQFMRTAAIKEMDAKKKQAA